MADALLVGAAVSLLTGPLLSVGSVLVPPAPLPLTDGVGLVLEVDAVVLALADILTLGVDGVVGLAVASLEPVVAAEEPLCVGAPSGVLLLALGVPDPLAVALLVAVPGVSGRVGAGSADSFAVEQAPPARAATSHNRKPSAPFLPNTIIH